MLLCSTSRAAHFPTNLIFWPTPRERAREHVNPTMLEVSFFLTSWKTLVTRVFMYGHIEAFYHFETVLVHELLGRVTYSV